MQNLRMLIPSINGERQASWRPCALAKQTSDFYWFLLAGFMFRRA